MPTIQFRTGTQFAFEQVLALYNDVGWAACTAAPEKLERAMWQSLCVVTAWSGEELVGLLRAVGDGETILYVQDILVLRRFHQQGIGQQRLVQLLEAFADVRQIVLMTDKTSETAAFYEGCGMTAAERLQLQPFVRIKSPVQWAASCGWLFCRAERRLCLAAKKMTNFTHKHLH